ncbi:PilZ domain-containing protein [Tepidibacillus fermentans]|uniref:PilZ domain-containing protein n=1 Tax=Tepidibacillus fermentans TaxID=1281767 RepID=A0A4R3KL34_9BACI|nr:PilZ domain-containing protein [Tepidibacillus fermentans]TCS84524.1 PilZ domain-containing protein [Tepidibacillus fermentans]
MLGSRIVCEGKLVKTEGIVKYTEGNFIVVELPSETFQVRQSLRCQIFEFNSTQTFQTTVVGKKNHHIILIAPPEIRERWIPRESPRFPIDIKGKISAVSFSGKKPLVELMKPYTVHIYDISEGGIGFSSVNYLREGAIAQIYFQLLNQKVYLEIEIVQNKYSDSNRNYYYGGKFIDQSSPSYQVIRTYTFQAQLQRIMNRENEGG